MPTDPKELPPPAPDDLCGWDRRDLEKALLFGIRYGTPGRAALPDQNTAFAALSRTKRDDK